MPDYETVRVHRQGGAATIELHRPESLNAWNAQLSADLMDALRDVSTDPEVRVVCLRGAGRGFCSGADLTDMSATAQTRDGRPDLHRSLVERYHPVMTAVRAMEKPVVAAVTGGAVGVGLSLALSADLVVCREDAYFLLAFVNIGLVPDGGASAFVAARVGLERATEMAMLGERVLADRALAWGLCSRVWGADVFDEEVAGLLDRLATGPTRSYAGTKRQLNAWMLSGWQDQLELEARIQQEMAGTDDFVEGAMSFVQKRQAAFKGR